LSQLLSKVTVTVSHLAVFTSNVQCVRRLLLDEDDTLLKCVITEIRSRIFSVIAF